MSAQLKFGKWRVDSPLHFTGVEITIGANMCETRVVQDAYLKKVTPITIDRSKKEDLDIPLNAREHHQLRGLIGSLQWPAAQSMPHGSASVSLLQASAGKPCLRDIVEANKTWRFVEEFGQGPLRFVTLTDKIEDMVLGVYTDASWGSRPAGSSQGGYYLFAIDPEGIEKGVARPLVRLDWAIRKLRRVAKSSLSAETQAAAEAVDALEWAVVFFAVILDPDAQNQ